MGVQPNMTSDLVKRERLDTKTAMHRKKILVRVGTGQCSFMPKAARKVSKPEDKQRAAVPQSAQNPPCLHFDLRLAACRV